MRMADDYRQSLIGAQICMPGTPDPCTITMPDDLFCGCPTYVNPSRSLDIDRMNYIIAAAANCPRMCVPIGCRPTSGGACMAEPNQNPPRPHCFDMQ